TDSYLNFNNNIFIIGYEFINQLRNIFFPFGFFVLTKDSYVDLTYQNISPSSSASRIDPLKYSDSEFLVSISENGISSLHLFTPSTQDLTKSAFTKLININTTQESIDYSRQIVGNFPAISSNRTIIYDFVSNYAPKLRSYNEVSKEFYTISSQFNAASLYRVLPNKNKVFFSDSTGAYIYDIPTKSKKLIFTGKYGVDICYLSGHFAKVINNEESVLFDVTCDKEQKLMQVSVSDYKVTEAFTGFSPSWENKDKTWLSLIEHTSNFSKVKISFYNTIEGKWYTPELAFLNMPSPFVIEPYTVIRQNRLFSYNKSSDKIYALANDLNNPKLYQFELSNHALSEICNSAKGIKIALSTINELQTFLISYDGSTQNYYFYKVMSSHCIQINEFHSSKNYIIGFNMSAFGFGLVLDSQALNTSTMGKMSSEIIFTPIDGSPSLKINPTGSTLKDFKKIEFTEDSYRILIHGMISSDTTNKLHIFKIQEE
ncbi:MAG: hypothetical protein KDD45_15155, partial [Bdellovibrionales bacterium]|nr:hypothetical protein [Bdellovibrionales bacterium]